MIAPMPYFGGKRVIAGDVWARLGDTPNYCEPFFGSGAVLLARPGWTPAAQWTETVNDADGMVSNFWRALQHDPEQLRHWADWPANENDLHARHAWLVGQKADITRRLEGDPEWYDVKVAGWWLWGICLWIGGGWCAGIGPWHVVDGELVNTENGDGVKRQRVHLGTAGRGINRQRVHLGTAGKGGQGEDGDGSNGLEAWINALAARMRRVRVCSGDWSRVMGDVPTIKNGLTGVFLDPPYSAEADRDEGIYAHEDLTVAHDARAWALEHGNDPLLRIALCGYRGEHDDLEDAGWTFREWKANGGYGSQGNGRGKINAAREVVWYSPHCLPVAPEPHTPSLFDWSADDNPTD